MKAKMSLSIKDIISFAESKASATTKSATENRFLEELWLAKLFFGYLSAPRTKF